MQGHIAAARQSAHRVVQQVLEGVAQLRFHGAHFGIAGQAQPYRQRLTFQPGGFIFQHAAQHLADAALGLGLSGVQPEQLPRNAMGKITRRQLIETITLAATTVGAAGSAGAAQAQVGVVAAGINHVSYNCPNFKQAADWYSKVFNLDQIGLKDNEVTLPIFERSGVTLSDCGSVAQQNSTPSLNACWYSKSNAEICSRSRR